MRNAHNNRGWIEAEDGTFLGLSLGFDFCAEHEQGASELRRTLGVDTAQPGFEAIRVTRPPALIRFETRQVRKPPTLKNPWHQRAVDPDKLHEAVLYVGALTSARFREGNVFELADQYLGKLTDLRWNHYDPAHSDLQTAWDGAEAMIRVRGQANVTRLQQVYDAMAKTDAVFNAPSAQGFTRRDGGLAFGIASRFSPAYKQQLMEQYEANQRLQAAVKASGIEKELADQGKRYYALSPAWRDPAVEKDLVFFLNPADQKRHDYGWFTVDELKAWGRDSGPVLSDPTLKAAETAANQGTTLLSRIKAAFKASTGENVNMRSLRACWMDEAKTRLGVDVWPANQASTGWLLTPGHHDFEDLLANPTAHVVFKAPTPIVAPDEAVPARRRVRHP